MPSSAPPGPAVKSVSFKILAGVGFVVVCLGLFAPKLVSTPSDAEPVVKQFTTPEESNPTPWGTLLKMTLGVGVVAMVWVAVARYVGRKQPSVMPSYLGVEASMPIDFRCVVHLVRVGERRLLVGSDSTGVKAVIELPASVREPTPVVGPVRVSVASEPDPADLAELLGSK